MLTFLHASSLSTINCPLSIPMPVLPILTGTTNPILRRKTQKVEKVTKELRSLIRDMRVTVKDAEGLGLAAPQVGPSLRICLARIGGRMIALINPEITWKSKETWVHEEGCLSLPGVTVEVERARTITVKYLDERGRAQERRLEEWEARVVQHEVDHLDGVLIVDYL